MPLCHVERRTLARLLRSLVRVNRGVEAAGTWTLRQGELQVDWGEGGGVLEATHEGDQGDAEVGEAVAHVSGAVMMRLQRVLVGPGTVAVSLRDGHLLLDRLAVAAFLHERSGSALLPRSPRPVDFLLLPERHPAEVLEAAGLTDKVAAAKARHAATLKAVAGRLAWLGISDAEVRQFVASRLKARAAGQEPLPFVDGGGR